MLHSFKSLLSIDISKYIYYYIFRRLFEAYLESKANPAYSGCKYLHKVIKFDKLLVKSYKTVERVCTTHLDFWNLLVTYNTGIDIYISCRFKFTE